MVRSCVLLGAGASKDAGIPTSLEMTWAVVERLEEEFKGRRDETLHAVYFALGGLMFGRGQQGQPPRDVDVEALFRAMELLEAKEKSEIAPFVSSWNEPRSYPDSGFKGRDLGERVREIAFKENGPFFHGNQLHDTVERIARGTRLPYKLARQRMVQTLRSIVWVPEHDTWNYLGPLTAEAASNPDMTIGTLNYDTGVEIAAHASGFDISTGFELDETSVQPKFPETGPRLIKLHGSIDWLRGSEWPRDGQFSEYRVTRIADPSRFEPTNEHREFQPALVFGEGNKLQAAGPFLDLLAEFRRHLERSNRLTIIGYSFRDDHVNHIIARWFNANVDRHITIVDPHWKGIYAHSQETQFRHTLTTMIRNSDRVNLIESTAADAIAEMAPILSSG